MIAREAVRKNGPLWKALECYKHDIGDYPSTADGLTVLFKEKRDHPNPDYKGPYLDGGWDAYGKDPWGEPYRYRAPGVKNVGEFDLWSCGPNRRDEGGAASSDDVRNWADN